jgi:ABC-type lipoprotein export system ATPase subunit
MELFRKLNQEDGVTIIQVTHSNENATFGTKIVRLQDGMVVNK